MPDHDAPDRTPFDLDAYVGAGGFSTLDAEPQAILDEVTASGLRGYGGAGFPAGRTFALGGVGLALSASPLQAVAGPFFRQEIPDHFVPADKKLSPAWVRALFAEAPVRIRDLIGMKLRHVPPNQVVLTYISAIKAGLSMTTGLLELQVDVRLVGGDHGADDVLHAACRETRTRPFQDPPRRLPCSSAYGSQDRGPSSGRRC